MTTEANDIMSNITSLCKRRGFIFQSSEIYGGLKSAYDYGPLGVELKRNIANEWWKSTVHEREDVVGIDASIMMAPQVWKASGHVDNFSDPLVDCLNCNERFRADKVAKTPAGTEVSYIKGGGKKGETIKSVVGECGYTCPKCNSTNLSPERRFNMMFRTFIGALDPVDTVISKTAELIAKGTPATQIRQEVQKVLDENIIYLRPETAQAMFVQFLNVQQTMSMKVPFGIAQIGKSFRNEITVEHSVFRTCEFEQMEMEYFVEPGEQTKWHDYWVNNRLDWWRALANDKNAFRARAYDKKELAHYADACYDIEYNFPWGWDELEGIASRTDFDLKQHAASSSVKLSYFDQQKNDPQTGKPGWRYVPYVIEPAMGLTRGLLVLLIDAYREEKGLDAEGLEKTRTLLKLNPKIAPIKAAVLPLVKKEGLPEVARQIVSKFYKAGISASFDEQQSIGKRYSRHDEIGTPYCLTVDFDTLKDECVTIRDRDTTKQERIKIDAALEIVKNRIAQA